jgi:hypothetical protein
MSTLTTLGRALAIAAMHADRAAAREVTEAERLAATYCDDPVRAWYLRAEHRDALGMVELVGVELGAGRFGPTLMLDVVDALTGLRGTVALTAAPWRVEAVEPLRRAVRAGERVWVSFATCATRDGLRTYVMVCRVDGPGASAVAA